MLKWLKRLIHRLVDWLDDGDGGEPLAYEEVSWHQVLGIKHAEVSETDDSREEGA